MGHGFKVNDTIDLYWSGNGERRNLRVLAITPETVTVDGGIGYELAAVGTQVQLSNLVSDSLRVIFGSGALPKSPTATSADITIAAGILPREAHILQFDGTSIDGKRYGDVAVVPSSGQIKLFDGHLIHQRASVSGTITANDVWFTIDNAGTDDPVKSLTEEFGPWLAARMATGTLSARTDNDTGSLSVSSGHGLVAGRPVDLYWNGGWRRGLWVTSVAGNVVGIDGGSGSALPNVGTAIHLYTDDLTASVGGDLNADGRDDLLVANRSFVNKSTLAPAYPGNDLGRIYVFTGRTVSSGASVGRDAADLVIQKASSSVRAIFGLGDLNSDGYDDFAVSRSREGGGNSEGSLFIYQGAANLNLGNQLAEDVYRANFSNLTGWEVTSSYGTGTALSGKPQWHLANNSATNQQYSITGGSNLWYGVPAATDYNDPSGVSITAPSHRRQST